ncbi:PaaX family transcriptional regulator [Haloactinomyces albus]|uniref:Phenylacetic acid degradation operon negative regulatory protein n=1 Tax=Haloactinomyces albus TaxID=1352928 RepID=A0AAE3ZHZ7_9ACTN|nr:PaaX family transcriptional regulator C-terminal domain-containing protein [Haloactinomyces albus]MDR7303562.1 phenylacetic acid degradation operon negative regulatory protein [Haloactinomyces albus]
MTTEKYAAERESAREPQPRQLIVTIFALYARGEHNWLSVASVVQLMADLGVESPAVRSSISRLKRKGTLVADRRAGTAGYSLSESTLEMLAEGDVRIFDRRRADIDDGWLLVVFSIPESERDKRHALRTTLTRLGFGTAAPGVWVAPGNLAREARETLTRRGMTGYVDMFHAEHLAFGDLRSKVRSWWDLDELTELYSDFLHRYRPVLEHAASSTLTPREAFNEYVPMLTEWRRLPYLDPGLPLQLLPPGWNGVTAGELFDQLNTALSGPAREHARAIIHP